MILNNNFEKFFKDLHESLPLSEDTMATGTNGVEVGGSHQVFHSSKDTDQSNVLNVHDLITGAHGPTVWTVLTVVGLVLLFCCCGTSCLAILFRLIKKTVTSFYGAEKDQAARLIKGLPLFRQASIRQPPRVPDSGAGAPAAPAAPVASGPPPTAFFATPGDAQGAQGVVPQSSAVLTSGNYIQGHRTFELYPQMPARSIYESSLPWSPPGRVHGIGGRQSPRSRSPSPGRSRRSHRRGSGGSR